MVVLDDEARRLKQKHKDEIKELEANKSRETERLKADFELVEKSHKDRINKLENLKHSHEEVIYFFCFQIQNLTRLQTFLFLKGNITTQEYISGRKTSA